MNDFDETKLQEYLDGALDAAERQEVEALLARSPAARRALAELQTVYDAFGEMPEVPLTADLAARVEATILAEMEATPAGSPWLRGLLLVQSAAAVLLLVRFWPTWQGWLAASRSWFTAWFTAIELRPLALWESVRIWGTAVFEQINFSMPPTPPPSQWLWLLAFAFVVWLLGNRLLFRNQWEQSP